MTLNSQAILTTKNLTKKYGNKFACENVNLTVNRGDIYGLIGRNGAGKTTILKSIAGLIFPTSGSFEFNCKNGNTVDKIGVLIESPGILPEFSARKNLELRFKAQGISSKGKIDTLLELVGLKGVTKKSKEFSLGMKQRLGLALALVGDPEILILDEPTNGMDPQGMKEFRSLIKKLSTERDITIIISSHILDELSKTATRFGIIDSGKLITEFTSKDIEESTKGRIVIKTDEIDKVIDLLEKSTSINEWKIDIDKIIIFDKFDTKELLKNLVENGIYPEEIYYSHQSLEEFYLETTGGANA